MSDMTSTAEDSTTGMTNDRKRTTVTRQHTHILPHNTLQLTTDGYEYHYQCTHMVVLTCTKMK